MKFLLITRDFPPPVADGMMRYAQCLAAGLSAADQEVVVLSGCSNGFSGHRPVRTDDNVIIYRYRSVSALKYRPDPWARFARLLESLARKHSVDRIVIQHPYHAAAAMHVREKLECPIIYISHTISAYDRILRSADRTFSPDTANEERERAAVNDSDAVVCVYTSQRRILNSLYGAPLERLHVVPTGVPTVSRGALTHTLSRLAHLRSRGGRLVLYVGRESWEKGTDLLPDIIHRVTALTDKATFVLVGIDRRRWFHYLLLPRTYMLPWLESSQLASLYRICHIQVVPSRRDSMPYVLLEAMASGVVPVVTDVDGLGEVVKNGYSGLKALVDRGPGCVTVDTPSLSAAIASLINDDVLRETLRVHAKEVIQQGHSLENQVQRFLEVATNLA